MNKGTLLAISLLFNAFAFAQQLIDSPITSPSLENKADKREQKQIIQKSFHTIGLDVAMPTFRNNMELTGFMHGPVAKLFGVFEIGLLKGTARKTDNPLVNVNAQSFFAGFGYNHLMLRYRNLNFGPSIGFRIASNELRDPYFKTVNMESIALAFGLSGGAFVKLGPVTLSGKMHLDGNINFAKGSCFKGLSIYPSFGIGFSPMEILLNPQEFSHTAMAHWVTDYNTTVSKSREYSSSGTAYDVTTYTSTWTDNYGDKNMSCRDIQPFFFIGPRVATNTTHFLKSSLISSYGANLGFRRGALFMNGFFEKANIYFDEPIKRGEDTSAIGNNIFANRLDGEFTKSTKYGAQIGVELINWVQSKDFIYKESRVKKATAFTSIILFAGYGRVQFGDLNFTSDSGRVSYENYLLTNPSNTQSATNNLLLNPTSTGFYSFGGQFGLGAIALNVEYSFYTKSYKNLNNWNVGFSYNLPVIRMARAIKTGNLKRKLRRMQ